LDTGNPTIHI